MEDRWPTQPPHPHWSQPDNLQSTNQPLASVQLGPEYREAPGEEREMAGLSGLPRLLLVLHPLPPLHVVAAPGRDTAGRDRVRPGLHPADSRAGSSPPAAGDISEDLLNIFKFQELV